MQDEDKTKEQLILELAQLRQRLETLEAQRGQVQEIEHEHEMKYRLLFNSGNDAIFVYRLTADEMPGQFIEVNDVACQQLGYTRDELLQLSPADINDTEMLARVPELMKNLLADEHILFEWVHVAKNGKKIPVEVNAHLFQFNDQTAVIAIARDITERKRAEAKVRAYRDHLEELVAIRTRELTAANEQLQQKIADHKRAEEALKASQEYAKSIIESSIDMIIAVDMDRRITEFNRAAQETFGYQPEEVLGKHSDLLYADPQQAFEVHHLTMEQGRCVREIFNKRKNGEVFPSLLSASVLCNPSGEQVGYMGVSRDITERKLAEETLQKRNRDLELLNRGAQAFISTLDLDEVLAKVLEEGRHLLDVVACSAWLIDPETDELICRQVTDPQAEIVRGWRLAPGQGLAGWVAQHGQSLNVPDVRADQRHFKGVDEQTSLPLRSILTVPLRVKEQVIGVIQAVAAEVDRFSDTDLVVLESLAATAAIAIENAQLYEQAKKDAETKARLLNEVNHRVKNNLATIIGLLYAERRRSHIVDEATYQAIMQDLIGRVQGLATAHTLLSASKWGPLSLANLTSRLIDASLQALPADKRVSVTVSPSPVQVTPKQANNLSLIINELVTNTIKHALPEQGAGHISVRITLEAETAPKSSYQNGGEQLIVFEYRDDGSGYPEQILQQEGYNVGLYLVQNIVDKDMRGELTLYNDRGAVTLIRFKPSD